MFALTTVLIAGGLAYTGSITYKQLRDYRKRFTMARGHAFIERMTELSDKGSGSPQALMQANRSLALASLSLSLTVAGLILNSLLIIASVPAALLIFSPTLQDAWRTLRQEHRITPPVLDATRVMLCIVMGYYFALALDTWLRTVAQRLLLHTEADFQYTLAQHLPVASPTVWRFIAGAEVETPLAELAVGDIIAIAEGEIVPADGIVRNGLAWIDERLVSGSGRAARKGVGDSVLAATVVKNGRIYMEITSIHTSPFGTAVMRERLEQMIGDGNYLANIGKQSGARMAPTMWTTFALLLPFWSANRAAGFLTTSFGSQMERLGPYTLQNFAKFALQQQILIYDGHALETLNLVNTIVVEARVANDPILRKQFCETIIALRRRRWLLQEAARQRFAIYLLADGDEVATQKRADALGFDDYFVEPLAVARAALLERMQRSGRLVCYVGSGAEEPVVTDKALVTIAIPSVGPHPLQQYEEATAHIVLMEKELKRLVQLFEIAAQFGASQGASLTWPLLMDLIDIGTTVFLHLGLTYSLLFSYSGLLGSALYTRLPFVRPRKQHHNPIKPLDPDRQIGDALHSSHA